MLYEKKYKLPLHIKNYVKNELYDYEKNKRIIKELQNSKSNTSTRTLLIASRRINQIETVYNKLPKEDKQAVKKIFYEHHSQIYKDSLGKTRLVNEDIFNEVNDILQKYKSIIGVSDDKTN